MMPVPSISAKELWNKGDKEFNDWRKEYDFPRIVEFLKTELPSFSRWMKTQNISEDDLIEFGPARFLESPDLVIIYEFRGNKGEISKDIRKEVYSIGESVFHEKTVVSKNQIATYFSWYRCIDKIACEKLEREFTVSMWSGNDCYFLKKLNLLNAGNIKLPANYIYGSRNLEFINIDNLHIDNVRSSSPTRLWYSSAINLKIDGDFHFLDAFKTHFTNILAERKHITQLNNGNFQSWRIIDCDINFRANNTTLYDWSVKTHQFNCTLYHTDILDCEFKEGDIKYPQDYERASIFHSIIKRKYAQLGLLGKAGVHYYKEKRFEQKSLLRPSKIYSIAKRKKNYKSNKYKIYGVSYIKYILLAFQNLLWGYGEKPERTFYGAMSVIILFSIIYFLYPCSETRGEYLNSLYFSIVTFTTLGYGDIYQKCDLLKLFSAIEAFAGLLSMGLFIAGFSNKSKDYS